jgi:general L-amino acid transport system substrate-binding protein
VLAFGRGPALRIKLLSALLLVLLLLATACTSGGGEQAADSGGDEPELDTTASDPAADQTEEEDPETAAADTGGDLLQTITDRGNFICGVNNEVPGFGSLNAEGDFVGFDIDFCRAVAAGLFNDPEAVEFRPLTSDQRFPALKSGEIDVLIRNTTWTATRDGGEGATFLQTTFYDGQGMMVNTDSGFDAIEDMANATVCVTSGTTTELNLASRFAAGNIPYDPLVFEDNETLQAAYIEGRCDGWTSDKSQLAAIRSAFPESAGGPESLKILDETFSKEPLGPAISQGNPEWGQVVDWVVYATIIAEEFGITQDNVEEMKSSENPEIRRFLGQPGGDDNAVFEAGLGFDDPEWAANVIAAVGNYGEIYERHVAPLGVERGPNELPANGGLLYAPPYR